jgi:hypothetical protein
MKQIRVEGYQRRFSGDTLFGVLSQIPHSASSDHNVCAFTEWSNAPARMPPTRASR